MKSVTKLVLIKATKLYKNVKNRSIKKVVDKLFC